ncbi:MAG: hypothetical protein M3530_00435, partial [Thermoproteota archaeon]|nr:hypothetical protein [Thermoproteota archaeon]
MMSHHENKSIFLYKVILLLLIFALCLSSSFFLRDASAKKKTDDVKVEFLNYDNPSLGVHLTYPLDWNEEPLTDGIRFYSYGLTNNYLDTFDVYVYPSACLPIDKVVQNRIDSLRQSNDFHLMKESTTELGGIPARMIVYTYSDSVIGVTKSMEVIGSNGQNLYVIMFSAKPDNYDGHLKIATSMINSIQLKLLDPSYNQQNYLMYENDTYGIKLSFPASWHKYDSYLSPDVKSSDYFVEFDSPCKSINDTYAENVVMSVNSLSGSDQTLADALKSSIDFKKETIPDFKLEKASTNTSFVGTNQNPAYMFSFYGKAGNSGEIIKGMEIGTVEGMNMYIISYYAQPQEFDSYFPYVQKMIDSITFSPSLSMASSSNSGEKALTQDLLDYMNPY